MAFRSGITIEHFTRRGDRHLPGLLGIRAVRVEENLFEMELPLREEVLACIARPAHMGRNTQVWDATVTHRETGKTIALFRCTQMVLWPKG